jgi:UPF0176 protein
LESEKYEPGVCCPHCADKLDPVRRASLVERNRQIQIARKKKRDHLGQDVALMTTRKIARKNRQKTKTESAR